MPFNFIPPDEPDPPVGKATRRKKEIREQNASETEESSESDSEQSDAVLYIVRSTCISRKNLLSSQETKTNDSMLVILILIIQIFRILVCLLLLWISSQVRHPLWKNLHPERVISVPLTFTKGPHVSESYPIVIVIGPDACFYS